MTHPVLTWLADHRADMLALLEALVNSDSPSRDKKAVDATGDILKAFFTEHGIPFETFPNDTYGEAIRAAVDAPGSNQRPILLMGHRDTVFPAGETLRRPFRIEAGRAYGPGVADMKAGLVMNVFVLAAFHALGCAPGPLAALITSDEEIASPSSRPLIEQQGRASRLVLNSEPGRASGNVVSGRKGGTFMRFEVFGKAAHSGANFGEGRSAIEEMAHKILALHALTDLDRGTTVNVGLGQRRPNRQHHRPACRGRNRPAHHDRHRPPSRSGSSRRHHDPLYRPRHLRPLGDQGRVPSAGRFGKI